MPTALILMTVLCDLLIIGGLAAFFLTGATHATALIPTLAGFILQIFIGAAILLPQSRDSLVAITGVLAGLGIAVALSRPIMKLLSGDALTWNAALVSQVLMAVGCAAVCFTAIVFLLSGPKG